MAWFNIGQRLRAFTDPMFPVKVAQAQFLEQMIRLERERAAFQAAETTRLNSSWTASSGDINSFLVRELKTMQNRSRWLFRNDGNAVSAMNIILAYVVGQGIIPQAAVRRRKSVKDQETGVYADAWVEDDALNEELDERFVDWAETCDIAGSDSSPEGFVDAQELFLRKAVEDGESLCHFVIDRDIEGTPLRLEFLEPEQLDWTVTEAGANPVVMGVETDADSGRPVAYHVLRSTKKGTVTKRYEAKYFIHAFRRHRPNQRHGWPWAAAVTQRMYQMNEYIDAELLACKLASCFSVFIRNAPGVTPGGDILTAGAGTQAVDSAGNKLSHVQPGIIANLAAGADISIAQPQRPSATFTGFTERLSRHIGAGLENGLSYEALTRDTSKTTFASGRLGQQMDFQTYRTLIRWMVNKFCRPTRRIWQDVLATTGAVELPGYFDRQPEVDYRRHEWIPSGWSFGINPVQEAEASRENMRQGKTTLADECGMIGRNWRQQLRLIRKIKKEAAALGLTLTSDGAVSIFNGLPPEKTPDPAAAEETAGDAATAAAAAIEE